MSRIVVYLLTIFTLALSIAAGQASAGDWPHWRYDAQRSAASPDDLPKQMQLLWTRQLPLLKPAWPDQPKMQFDAAYEPIVLDDRLFIGSPHDGSVSAYRTDTGEELWHYYTNGPVRFAPLGWQGKVYCVSDDGYMYCLNARDGSLVWRFRGGPSDRLLLGNERLISTWPARGAPVLQDGTIYFAAGIWPFMGIFMHALDAETGKVVWTTDGDGSTYIKQPHNTDSFAGVAPQGAMVAIGDKLLVPGGRSIPACYNRLTGKLIYYQLAENGKRGGGSTVSAVDQLFFNGGAAFDLNTEKYLGYVGEQHAFADGRLFHVRDGDLRVLDLSSSAVKLVSTIDRKGAKVQEAKWSVREVNKVDAPPVTTLIKAGSRIYAGTENRLLAWDVATLNDTNEDIEVAWEAELSGTPASLLAADDKLFAVTQEGTLACFGKVNEGTGNEVIHHSLDLGLMTPLDSSLIPLLKEAAAVRNATGVHSGHCLLWGVDNESLLRELSLLGPHRVIVIEPDVQKVNALRDELRKTPFPADRLTFIVADPLQVELPPYLASLITCGSLPPQFDIDRAAMISKTFATLRPYGGTACLPIPENQREAYSKVIAELKLPGAKVSTSGDWLLLTREGPLPNSAPWTHEHADAANTRVSKDAVVKAPLGLLWFGGPSNDAVLPRHGHGPQPQVINGRLFIEGPDMLRAMDVYTGQVLWQTALPGIGELYDNTSHQPGANAAGTNYIATTDGVYVAYKDKCLKLDPATGKQLAEFKLPGDSDADRSTSWGYLNVVDDCLVGGGEPLFDPKLGKGNVLNKLLQIDNDNFSSSKRLVVMDRQKGSFRWSAQAASGFRHNAICIGGGRIYAIDRLSGAQLSRYKRRGESPPHPARLVVFDLKTGEELWSTTTDVFGTWLSYSAERDILIEAGRTARDTLSDEPKGMRAYRASDGKLLWENKSYSGPGMIHHDTVLMAGNACDLQTGAAKMREHPLTGEPVEWTWTRNYGCNTPAASEHLLTFRSGAAGYFDLCNDGGTGNFGGFRSSCTNNLIVADGVLSAPDYTRTCTCSYQNQTSLALVYMPSVELWTSFGAQTPKLPLRRVGINLGAPGDRKADDGTLWLEYPSIGGSSPSVTVSMTPNEVGWFRRHSSQVAGDGLSWVDSSGAVGLNSLKIQLSTTAKESRRYQVKLHFLEPEDVAIGERLFDVRVQGKPVAEALDVVKASGGRNRAWVQKVDGVEVERDLLIELSASAGSKNPSPVLSGVEIIAEGW